MPRRSALVVIIVLALAGGAIINLAVAWACCWWQKPVNRLGLVESIRVSDEAKRMWADVFGESIFLDRPEDMNKLDPATTPTSPIYGAMAFWLMENRWQSVGMERWWIFDMSRSIAPNVRIVRAGWPLFAFGCRIVNEPSSRAAARSAWERGGFEVRSDNRRIEFPWKPMWPGFAANTMLYSLVIVTTCLAARAFRRARRRRRGLCVECGYPVGVSEACSECGSIIVRG